MPQLTALKVKNLNKPGRYGDGNGLYLRVKPSGSKSWVQRITINQQRTDLGLGSYPAITLAQARHTAAQNHAAIAAGEDPRLHSKNTEIPTFAHAAQTYYDFHRKSWRSDRYARLWWSRLITYAYPTLEHLPVNQPGPPDVIDILLPIWYTKTETAHKVRQALSSIFKWAMANQWTDTNPAGDAIDAALPRTRRVPAHHKALPYQQVANAIQTINRSTALPITKLCFRFLVLTATRSAEAREATWSEINIPDREWLIPASRMKAPKPHRIPLSDAAVEVLHQAKKLQPQLSALGYPTDLVFPSPLGKPLTDSTISKLLRENNIGAVPHGFRSSFRDWASEMTNASSDCMELSLAHVVGTPTKRAYARSDLFDQRTTLMQAWADHLARAFSFSGVTCNTQQAKASER